MDEEDIGTMVTRLTMDTTSYQASIQEAIGSVKAMVRQVEQISAASTAFHAYSDFVTSQRQLDVAVREAGYSIENARAQADEFARTIAETTTISYQAAYSLKAMAAQLGLFGEKADEAIKLSIGLQASGLGIGSFMGLRIAVQLIEGNVKNLFMLNRILPPSIKNITDEKKKLAAITGFLAKMYGIEAAKLEIASGLMKAVSNDLHSLYVEGGKLVADTLYPFIQSLRQVTQWLLHLSPELKKLLFFFIAVTTSIFSLTAALRVLKLLGVSMFSPWPLVIGAASAAILAMVEASGGLKEIWGNTVSLAQRAIGGLVALGRTMGELIQDHSRLALAIGLVLTPLLALLAAYRLTIAAIALVNIALTLLGIKQALAYTATIALRAALVSWNAILLTVAISSRILSTILGIAGVVGALILQYGYILLSMAAWIAWKALMIGVRAAMLLLAISFNIGGAAVSTMSSLMSALGTGISFVTKVLSILSTGFRTFISAISAVGSAVESAFFLLLAGNISAAAAALGVFDIAETIATFGLNLLVAAIVLIIAGMAAFGAAAGAAAGATLVWDGALAPLVGIVVALAGTISLLVAQIGLFIGVASTAIGTGIVVALDAISLAAHQVLDAFSSLGSLRSMLAPLTGELQQWGTILYNIYQAVSLSEESFARVADKIKSITSATTGIQLAWEMVQAAFQLAVAEIKAIWPGIWKFILTTSLAGASTLTAIWKPVWLQLKDSAITAWMTIKDYTLQVLERLATSFSILWENANEDLKVGFFAVLAAMVGAAVEVGGIIAQALRDPVMAGVAAAAWVANMTNGAKGARRKIENVWKDPITPKVYFDIDAHKAIDVAIEEAKKSLDALIAKINQDAIAAGKDAADAIANDPAVIAAKKRLKDLENVMKVVQEAAKEAKKAEPFGAIAKSAKDAAKEVSGLHHVLTESNEALSRIAEYNERMKREPGEGLLPRGGGGGGEGGRNPMPGAPPKPEGAGNHEMDVRLLNAIKQFHEYMQKDFHTTPQPVRLVGIGVTKG